MKIRIGTRGSRLALWQANHIAARLREREKALEVEIVVLKTRGDQVDMPLHELPGKSFFTAEIENALLSGEVDLAVHSHKDLATLAPEGLCIAAVPPRGRSSERLLVASGRYSENAPFLPLRKGATVGTSSPRRREQLLALRPDLQAIELRGNVDTRVRRLAEGRFDALLLAAAGLDRLGISGDSFAAAFLAVDLPVELLVPAPGQGALAVQAREGESRREDHALRDLCRSMLHDEETARCVEAERELLRLAGGGCYIPLGAHVELQGKRYRADLFLGRGCPSPAHEPRWSIGEGADASSAAMAAFAAATQPGGEKGGPLAGIRVALTGLGATDGELHQRLTALGAQVNVEAVIAVQDLPQPKLGERVSALRKGDILALTSRQVLHRLEGCPLPEGVLVAAVGHSTARAAREVLGRVDIVGDGFAAGLARKLPLEPGTRVLFPCAEEAREELVEGLEGRGASVERMVLYRTVPRAGAALEKGVDARVYMSPSAVAAAAGLDRDAPAVRRFALGPSTHAALIAQGLAAQASEGSGPEAVVGELARFAAERRTIRTRQPS